MRLFEVRRQGLLLVAEPLEARALRLVPVWVPVYLSVGQQTIWGSRLEGEVLVFPPLASL